MGKSADAFRTISEVADWLEVPAHVLRFWESKFTQVKPVKRAGGRRYYRPADMRLLGGIKVLLHNEGLTIKGVQKMLREQGVSHVAALSPPFVGDAAADETTPVAQVLNFARPDAAQDDAQDAGTAEREHAVADDAPAGPDAGPGPEAEAEPAPDPHAEAAPAPDPPATSEPQSGQTVLPDTAPERPAASQAAPRDEPDAHSQPEAGPEPEPASASPAPALPPLPELPPDPPDDMTAASGALARLAALPRPLPARLAPGLAALAERLRAAGTPKP